MTNRPALAVFSISMMACLYAGPGTSSQTAVPGTLPERLERYLAGEVRPTQSERRQLMAGAPMTKLLPADEGREVAVFGAVWIEAPPARYVEVVNDIEHFEQGGAFRVTRRISNPPVIDDFAELTLPDEDVKDLRSCRVGDCEIKLSAEALKRIRTEVDWKSPTAAADARAAFRRLALAYVTGYLEGGNSRLAVYRDKDRPRLTADEFRALADRMPGLAGGSPDLVRYLLEYPAASLADSTDFLYWQETKFGLKPTIRISHLVIQRHKESTVVASKMLYASHYFWSALELRMLVPDPARGSGFWFVTVNRSRSDGLGGFFGRMVRSRVRDEVRKGTVAALTATKARLER